VTRVLQLGAVLAALALLSAGCVLASPASPVAPFPASRSTIYFLVDGGSAPIGVRRDVRRSYARDALEQLLAGPSSAEASSGNTTALPPRTTLVSLSFRRRASSFDAFVGLSGLPDPGANAPETARIITQVARTLIGISGIGRIWLRNDGHPWGFYTMQGRIHDGPYNYDDLFYQICSAKPGTEDVPGDCFSALP
jgi:Sporulation and spore germination